MSELNELFKLKEYELSLSYSRVSDFIRNGVTSLTQRKENFSGDGVRIGSLVDDLIFQTDNFDDLYYVFEGEKPTATLGKLVDVIFENYPAPPDMTEILKICDNNAFWKRWNEEKRIETINVPEFWDYLEAMYQSKQKTIITHSDLSTAESLVEILLTHPHSKDIFNEELVAYNQFKFTFTYKKFTFRGIIDRIIVDHDAKTIRFIDLKTGKNPINEFEYSYLKWNYYIQEAVYCKAFRAVCKALKLKGYKLLPFQFLYISRFERIPLLFTVPNKWHRAALKGFKLSSGKKYKGLNALLNDIRWHLDNNVMDVSRQIYESKGELLLDDSFITVT